MAIKKGKTTNLLFVTPVFVAIGYGKKIRYVGWKKVLGPQNVRVPIPNKRTGYSTLHTYRTMCRYIGSGGKGT
jgi:hypothetical protein